MQTVYDWVTVTIFAGLVALFLQRSSAETLVDKIWHYAPPAIGCAAGNWLGNNDYDLAAIAVLIATVGYIFVVLKPGTGGRIG